MWQIQKYTARTPLWESIRYLVARSEINFQLPAANSFRSPSAFEPRSSPCWGIPNQWLSKMVKGLDNAAQHRTPLTGNLCSGVPHWVGRPIALADGFPVSSRPLSFHKYYFPIKFFALLTLSQHLLPGGSNWQSILILFTHLPQFLNFSPLPRFYFFHFTWHFIAI